MNLRIRIPLPIPRRRLLLLFLIAAVPIALGGVSVAFVWLGVLVVIAAFLLAALDLRAAAAGANLSAVRESEPQLSLAAPNRVRIRFRNASPIAARGIIRDDPPASFAVDRRAMPFDVPPGGEVELDYVARPRHRGTFAFGDIYVRWNAPLGLVAVQGRETAAAEARVYPDLREIRRYEVSLRRGLAYDAGQRRARQAGAGSLFERLREYTPDDDPRSISWTATARRGRPISVEYETERQQRVLILLDAGRMMASTLGDLTKLDHAVNTALMLGYLATAKGDEVGLMGFSDAVRSYLLPRRGRRQFLRIADELRRLEVTTTETDYRAAFEFLRARTSRRALVVLFTDVVDEQASKGLVAAVTRLAGNNLVLCCLLADPRLAELAAASPSTTTELYERVVAHEVREARERALGILRQRGVHTIDVPAERLTVATIQRYLELKKRAL